ncbi:ML domain-containing protein [Radiomyces spectabilis]|uniref:ML domain-containing protein n=1 Tax=Radiomyces spectabilis TaxID=64574 RepID=UPI00221F86DA|nr:ML domain-containing protein [Radiomyces spectabilis]KAI8373157.1 ML domain-containing protein [Radiomyces spectabilis]
MKVFTSLLLTALLATLVRAFTPNFIIQDGVQPFKKSTDLIENCGDPDDILEIDYITLDPDPPMRGQNLTIDFKGTLSKEVPEGTVAHVEVKFGRISLLRKDFDLCHEIENLEEHCPIPKGELVFTKQVTLPSQIPPGRYTVKAVIDTPDDEEVACLIGRATFSRR